MHEQCTEKKLKQLSICGNVISVDIQIKETLVRSVAMPNYGTKDTIEYHLLWDSPSISKFAFFLAWWFSADSAYFIKGQIFVELVLLPLLLCSFWE